MRHFMVIPLIISLILNAWAFSQRPSIPPEFLDERRRLSGDHLIFCINEQGLASDFERAVAAELANVLLLDYSLHKIRLAVPVPPFDYRIPIREDELYVLIADHCDAIMGFSLAARGYPEWLVLTRAYFRSSFVFATINEAFTRLGDIPRDRPVGTRSGSLADIRFTSYLLSLAPEERWRRFPYRDNELLMERLLSGEIAVALIWEPALYALYNDGNLKASGIRVIMPEPFQPPDIEFGIAVRSGDAFLRTMLDQAIAALIEDGVIDQLLQTYGLPGSSGVLGR